MPRSFLDLGRCQAELGEHEGSGADGEREKKEAMLSSAGKCQEG